MTTFPDSWRTSAELLRLAARSAAATFGEDTLDLWRQVFTSGRPAPQAPIPPTTTEEAPTPDESRDLWALVRGPAAPGSTQASCEVPTAAEADALWARLRAPIAGLRTAVRIARLEPEGDARLAPEFTEPTRPAPMPARPCRVGRDALGVHVLLERGDDVATVLGRIEAAADPEVVLVVPRGVASVRTAPAWARLSGHVRRRGLTLRVVAARAEVRGYARQTGLGAARTWQGLPAWCAPFMLGDFALPSSLPAFLDSLGARFFAMLATLSVAVTVFAYFGPLARIEVSPPSVAVEQRVQIRVDPIAPRIDMGTLTLPATTVQRSVRVVVSSPATGSAPVGGRPAGVRLEFRNDGDTPIDVPAGTVGQSDTYPGFATTERLTVPAGRRASVDVLAVQPGTAGNVGAGAVHLLASMPRGLSVVNPQAARGGADRLVPAVAQADVDHVRALAHNVLTQAAMRDARAAHEGGLVLPSAVSIAVLGQTPYQRLEEQSDVFVAEYVAQASISVVLPETASRFAEWYLRTQLPPSQDLVPGFSRLTFEGSPTAEGGQSRTFVTVSGRASDRLDANALAAVVTGATPRDAKDRLRERLAIDVDPRVNVTPSWLPRPWLPRRADRIDVTLGSPNAINSRPIE
ncbi:MAG: hypothetical protein EXR66_05320 [Dehalococcoidia bacterium]|nr:hypothetical protein [Dehalococcoidia bacterium]